MANLTKSKNETSTSSLDVHAKQKEAIATEDQKYAVRLSVLRDMPRILEMISNESKSTLNVWLVPKEELKSWILEENSVVAIEDGKIIAHMGAEELLDDDVMELRSAVVEHAFRKGNVNENNRERLLDNIFARNPNAVVCSVRNGAHGERGINAYFKSMSAMGFKKLFELRGGEEILYEETLRDVLETIPNASLRNEVHKALNARMSMIQAVEKEDIEKGHRSEKEPRALMTVLTRDAYLGSAKKANGMRLRA